MQILSLLVKVMIMVHAYASVCCFCVSAGGNGSVSAVFIFGDSFVDQGNNNYVNTLARANFLPYGIDFLGGKPTGRCSNSRNLPDFLAATLGVKEYIPAYLEPLITNKDLQTGVSFASAASGYDPQTTTITILSLLVKVMIMVHAYASVCCFCVSAGGNGSVSAVFIFGDSFVDQGNNNYVNTLARANFLPYGIDFLGGKPTGRCSNSRNLPDFLAATLGVKEYIPAYLEPLITDKDLQTGVSFASAASGYDPLTTSITTGIPMSVQLEMFKEYIRKIKKSLGEKDANKIITNSVVLLVSGNNDLLFSLPAKSLQYDVQGYANMLVKLVLNFTQELHMLGVQKIGVFSTPPIGCLPALRTLGGGILRKCSEKHNNISQVFNKILMEQLQLWVESVPETKVAYIDFYNTLINLIEKHCEYGFDVADRGCCGTGEIEVSYACNKLLPTCPDRSKFLFWDGFHLSEKGYNVFVNHIHDDLVNNLF